ncbi:hypothetical protein ACIHCQ_30550 [Streptomyces sp. NPDC052236]|uniref:hypothetical protein n=1 Tax=Streptomyces sp. NPDC052236 TaxID=3365686 RepID=UPI0037D6D781
MTFRHRKQPFLKAEWESALLPEPMLWAGLSQGEVAKTLRADPCSIEGFGAEHQRLAAVRRPLLHISSAPGTAPSPVAVS